MGFNTDGLGLELVAGILGVVVILVGFVRWTLGSYAEYRVKESAEETEHKRLAKRVETLESDLKNMANANIQLSNTFHTEINKVLHKLAGTLNE